MSEPTRTPIADAVRAQITEAWRAVPDGKRGALLILADEHGARVMVAAKFGSRWLVAAEGAKPWAGPVTGVISVQGSW